MKLILFTNIYHSILTAPKQEKKIIPRNESENMLATILAANKSPIPQIKSDEFHTPNQSPTHSPSGIIPTQLPDAYKHTTAKELSDWDNCLDGVFNVYQIRTNTGFDKKYLPVVKKK